MIHFKKPHLSDGVDGVWHEDTPPRNEHEPLPERCDVCIVGGGFTGLWTAYWLLQSAPEFRIVLLESEICGSGASGRNGGVASSWVMQAPKLLQNYGSEIGSAIIRESMASLDRIEHFCEQFPDETQFSRRDWMSVLPEGKPDSFDLTNSALAAMGLPTLKLLNPTEAATRSGLTRCGRAVASKANATLRPGGLVNALRTYLIRNDVHIAERHHVRKLHATADRRHALRVATSNGDFSARHVVLALNAWAHQLPAFRRKLLPVAVDSILVSGPSVRTFREAHPAVTFGRMNPIFYRDWQMPDNESALLIGTAGRAIPLCGQIDAHFYGACPVADSLFAKVLQLFPKLADTTIRASWTGSLARSSTTLPSWGNYQSAPNVWYAHGYSGHGVVATETLAKTLAEKIAGKRKSFGGALKESHKIYLPPEPLRYMAANVVRIAAKRVDKAYDQGQKPGWLTSKIAAIAYK